MDLMSILRQAGFKEPYIQTAYAIAMAESSGNAKAHNGNSGTGDNSYGLFQINMLGGMGPERRKRFGLSSNDDLFDPLTNALAAYQMSNGGRNWGPWSTYTNGAYKQYLGQSGATVSNDSGGGGGGGSSSSSATKIDPLSGGELAESYGFVQQLFDSVPELKSLFAKAVKAQWSASKFQAELRDSKWWKKTSDTARKFLTLQYGDPATAKQQLDQARVKVNQLADSLGLRDTKGVDKQRSKWALDVVMNGWSDAQLRYDMGKWITFAGDVRQGEAGETFDKLQELAYNMGVTMSNKWYTDSSRAVVRGTGALQDFEDEIRRSAKSMFPSWSKQIDSGQTVADIASPYFSSMSQILELPSGSINLFDPTIKKALQAKDSTGKNSVVPIWQFENNLRADNRWLKTSNAQNSMMQVAHQVLSDFGVKT